VKLLLDENLSRRIVPRLQESYPGTSQVSLLGLEQADDQAIWAFAKLHGYLIVTKDDDFQGLLALAGHPPRVIQLLMGNCNNQQVLAVLLENNAKIAAAFADPEVGVVYLY